MSSFPLGFYEGETQRHELRADMRGVNVSVGIPNHRYVMYQCYYTVPSITCFDELKPSE